MDNFSLQNWRIRVVNEDAFKEGMGELNVYEYQTNHFDMCPSAQTLFKDILRGEFTDGMPSAKEQDKIVELAKLHDTLFALEKIALKDQGDAKAVFDKVIETASDIYELATEIGLDKNVDLRYIQGHVQRVNDAARGEDEIGRPLDEDKAERMATLIKQRDALIKKHSDAGEMFSDKVYDLDSQIQKIAKSESLDEIELEIPGDEDKAPAGDKALNVKLTKNDKIINAYKEIEQEIKDSIQKMKSGNEDEKKAALDFLKANQDTIKAYNNLKKV
jgi:gas vesicle protein